MFYQEESLIHRQIKHFSIWSMSLFGPSRLFLFCLGRKLAVRPKNFITLTLGHISRSCLYLTIVGPCCHLLDNWKFVIIKFRLRSLSSRKKNSTLLSTRYTCSNAIVLIFPKFNHFLFHPTFHSYLPLPLETFSLFLHPPRPQTRTHSSSLPPLPYTRAHRRYPTPARRPTPSASPQSLLHGLWFLWVPTTAGCSSHGRGIDVV